MTSPLDAKQRQDSDEMRLAYIDVMEAIADDDLEVAQSRLERLVERSRVRRDNPGILFLSTVLAIQRGNARDALQALNAIGENACPELRVLCLYSIGDPLWEGMARSLVDCAEPRVRASMKVMLDRYYAVIHAPGASLVKPHVQSH